MKKVSFLLGSGFSSPAGYPTAGEINERLRKIDASEICIHTDGHAWFLGEEKDPNAHCTTEERHFVQEFLEFYNNNVIGDIKSFHYEKFYDYYYEFIKEKEYTKELAEFLKEFQEKNIIKKDSHLLPNFHKTFNQLIAQLLMKDNERVHLAKPYCHSAFLNLLELLGQEHKVEIHTLNHDLYMEHLSHSDSIKSELDDGFEELGSPFYGKLNEKYERYMVRLPYFTNKYDKKFCLYKLHGGINHYWFRHDNKLDRIKIKRRIHPINLYKEILENGSHEYVNEPANFFPDFLSGRTSKIERYKEGSYFPTMIDHFKNNLRESNNLIVIGYGFGDDGINEIIKNCFVDLGKKTMSIVDISEPETDFMQDDNVHFVDGGVSDMNIESILNKMS
jgi:hypothetical protein